MQIQHPGRGWADAASYGMTVRIAVSGEQRILENVQRSASLAGAMYRDALISHPDAIELPLQQILDGHVFVALEHDRIFGFSVVLPRTDGDAELDGLFVEPGNWRKSVGTRLLREAARRAVDAGASKLYVLANPQAEAFYASCGFELVGTGETRFGPANVLVLALSGPTGPHT